MRKHKYLLLTISWMAVIFIFSSQNAVKSNENNLFLINLFKWFGIDLSRLLHGMDVNFIIRKLAHLTEYAILGGLLYRTFYSYFYSRWSLYSIAWGFLYACTDEFHQSFIPGRSPSFRDVCIDTSGVILGVMIALIIYHTRERGRGISA